MYCVLYARVSGEEQKQGKTIESQIKELEDFAKSNDYVIVGKYIDEGWSGALLNRPALDRLRDDAAKNLFQAVLVNDVDRLSREVTHLGIIKKDLESKGIRLIFKKMPDNDNSPVSTLLLNMLGSFAQFERELIADRTRRGKRYKVEVKKQVMGSKPYYGVYYITKDKDRDGYYKINRKEAKVVEMMFNWVHKERLSARGATKRLTEFKIPTRKGSTKWGKSTVYRILTNEAYIGNIYYNRTKRVETKNANNQEYSRQKRTGHTLRPKDEWIALYKPELKIIADKVFWAVQEQLKRNGAYASRNNTTNFYLLRGLLKCGVCGSPYYGTPCHGKLYYRCGNRDRMFPLPRKCKASMISINKLEPLVWDSIVKAVQNPSIIIEQVRKLQEKQKRLPSKIETEINETRRELKNLEVEEGRMLKAYKIGAVQLEQFQKEMEQINNDKTQLSQRLKYLDNEKAVSQTTSVKTKGIKKYCYIIKKKLQKYTNEQKQIFLRSIIEGIIIEGKKITIQGLIPEYYPVRKNYSSDKLTQSFGQNNANCSIVPITPYQRGHNTTLRFELVEKIR